MTKHFKQYLSVVALCASVVCAQADANHLVLSEVGIYPVNQADDASAEYVEIFNPTSSTVSLDNYYLTDTNNYAALPSSPTGKVSGATTDHLLRFPAGFELLPGQVAVVTGGGSNFLAEFHGGLKSNYDALVNSPLLFEVGTTNTEVVNMISLNNSSTRPVNFNLTNPSVSNGEFSILFYWNGTSEAVKDVDMASWGTPTVANAANGFTPKTAAPYQPDGGTNVNLSISNAANVVTRTGLAEDAEVATGGNGITGHDESTEVTASNWSASMDRTTMSPGITSMTLSTTNVPPTISSVVRDKVNPDPAEQFTITANATDPDGTVATVKIFVAVNGGSYTEPTVTASGSDYSATVGGYDNSTTVTYYIEVTDNDGDTAVYPFGGATSPESVLIDTARANSEDIVINEILYDRIATDSDEWFEIYNRSPEEKSLRGFTYYESSGIVFSFPDEAVIAGNGFVLLTFRPAQLALDYEEIPIGTPVYQYPSGLENTDETMTIKGPNGVVDFVNYSNTAPWPVTASNTSGRSIELLSPELDNSVPGNWVGSPPKFNEAVPPAPKMGGSPGRHNSVFSHVSDWAIY